MYNEKCATLQHVKISVVYIDESHKTEINLGHDVDDVLTTSTAQISRALELSLSRKCLSVKGVIHDSYSHFS